MDMKSAKNAHFWQVDHRVKRIAKAGWAEILPSKDAWKKYTWSRKYFDERPNEGYFVWVKGQPDCQLLTCVNIVGKGVKQEFKNLLVVEENLKIDLEGFCGNSAKCFKSAHRAVGNIVIKKNTSLVYRHIHSWGQDSVIEPNYDFLLEENVKLDYIYKVKNAPKLLRVKNKVTCMEGASATFQILADCKNTKFNVDAAIELKGKGASAVNKLRLVARKESNIKAYSRMFAKSPSKGHLDCQGLMTDKSAKVTFVPEVVCEDKEAQITHEASIGKISEEQLNYLRTRGLNEEQAINLITSGFLRI
jgi:Fe-S cluster assembly scaffold protein SufB